MTFTLGLLVPRSGDVLNQDIHLAVESGDVSLEFADVRFKIGSDFSYFIVEAITYGRPKVNDSAIVVVRFSRSCHDGYKYFCYLRFLTVGIPVSLVAGGDTLILGVNSSSLLSLRSLYNLRFLFKHLNFAWSRTKPSGVIAPICPAIAATHIGKFAWASVSFFHTFGFTVTEKILPLQSNSKYCKPFSTVLTSGSSLILMVSSSFPVVAIN
jgi:hypothetical protein